MAYYVKLLRIFCRIKWCWVLVLQVSRVTTLFGRWKIKGKVQAIAFACNMSHINKKQQVFVNLFIDEEISGISFWLIVVVLENNILWNKSYHCTKSWKSLLSLSTTNSISCPNVSDFGRTHHIFTRSWFSVELVQDIPEASQHFLTIEGPRLNVFDASLSSASDPRK